MEKQKKRLLAMEGQFTNRTNELELVTKELKDSKA